MISSSGTQPEIATAALGSCRSRPQSRSILRCVLNERRLAVAAWLCVIGGVDLRAALLRWRPAPRGCNLDLAAYRRCLPLGKFAFSCHSSALWIGEPKAARRSAARRVRIPSTAPRVHVGVDVRQITTTFGIDHFEHYRFVDAHP